MHAKCVQFSLYHFVRSLCAFNLCRVWSGLRTYVTGRFCYDDDLYTITSAYHPACSGHQHAAANIAEHPYHDVPINSLKHRLLVHLYQQAVIDASAAATPKPVLVFFRHFDEFRRLRMWKMQLLDENHLLIRYSLLIFLCPWPLVLYMSMNDAGSWIHVQHSLL